MKKFIIALTAMLICNLTFSQNDTVYQSISVTQAKDTIENYLNNPWFVILDVRTIGEYNSAHLEQGIQLDYYNPKFDSLLGTLNKSKTYLLHCASGGRSGQVFTKMQNQHFKKVYNMTGGLNAWTSASYPTTTSVSPAISALCDTNLTFDTIPVGTSDSILLTITNSANDTLKFISISDLSGTDFSANFNLDTTLFCSYDYSFYVHYNPSDELADSTVISVETNAGITNFYVKGNVETTTKIEDNASSEITILKNANSKSVVINSNSASECFLYNLSGSLIYNNRFIDSESINYQNLKSGIYFLKVQSKTSTEVFKIAL